MKAFWLYGTLVVTVGISFYLIAKTIVDDLNHPRTNFDDQFDDQNDHQNDDQFDPFDQVDQ